VDINVLKKTLLDFATNPDKSWGDATDGWGNPGGIDDTRVVRVSAEQGDRNTARMNSGTYTSEQYADFDYQLGIVERTGSGTAYFPGDPDNLPDDLPECICTQCRKSFRSCKGYCNCYHCELDRLCPPLPGRHINAHWNRDEWSLEAFGDIGFHNKLTFWWSNRNSGGNAQHQGLTLYRDRDGEATKMVFTTSATNARRRYRITFDLKGGSVSYSTCGRSGVNDDMYTSRYEELDELDPLVLDFILAMAPSWMLFEHRPRNPANGCFAVA
jgi:hypothetical protein